jgi:hypothetical protein
MRAKFEGMKTNTREEWSSVVKEAAEMFSFH